MKESLTQYIRDLDLSAIPEDRLSALDRAIEVIYNHYHDDPLAITFICTHNSRRSHLSQVWMQVMASHYNLSRIITYSGGTEATAVYPSVLSTLSEQGLDIQVLSEGANPIYAIRYHDLDAPIPAFSKPYDHPYNPQQQFIAVMTCDSAVEACPVVHGAAERLAILYQDPKVSDGTEHEANHYLERSIQIATEMKYICNRLSVKIESR